MRDFEQEILEKQVAQKEEKLRNENLRQLAYALDTSQGQLVLEEILKLCPIDQEVFSTDPCMTAYLCGKRSVGLAIATLVKNINGKIIVHKKEE